MAPRKFSCIIASQSNPGWKGLLASPWSSALHNAGHTILLKLGLMKARWLCLTALGLGHSRDWRVRVCALLHPEGSDPQMSSLWPGLWWPGYRLKGHRGTLSCGNYAAGKRESSWMFCMSELNSSGECCQVLGNRYLLLNPLNGQLCGLGFTIFQIVLLPGLGASAGQGSFPGGSLHVATLFWKLAKFGGINMSCSMPPDLRARWWSWTHLVYLQRHHYWLRERWCVWEKTWFSPGARCRDRSGLLSLSPEWFLHFTLNSWLLNYSSRSCDHKYSYASPD